MNFNPIVFALRHPITVMVGIAALVVGSVLAVLRMKIDIFPSLNLPVIYVAQPYGGMDPAQMEGLITNYYEYHFLYINGIHHVESKNVQGVALMKLFFHPGTDMAQAMAETVGYVNRARAFMPPGTVPPFIMRFDTGSVPVGYLVLSQRDQEHRRDPGPGAVQGPADVRQPARRLGAAAVRRQPAHHRRQRRSRPAARLQPVARRGRRGADHGQHHQPVGQHPHQGPDAHRAGQRHGRASPRNWATSPSGPGDDVYLRDLGTIEDSTDIPTGYALVNGQRAVYILVTKRADASTLAVVNEVKANLPKMQAAIPEDIKVSFEFDQSPYVTRAMWGVGTEGLLGAVLTGLMVLLFLRDWRSVIVVVLNIPFALLGSRGRPVADAARRINLMTLGGLALAVGILVDEATVEVENIHTQFEHTPNIARAVRLRQRGDGRAAPAGHAVHPGGVHPVVLHGGGGPGAVRAAVAGGRLRDGGLVPPVQHVRAGAVGLAAAPLPPSPHARRRAGLVLASPACGDGYAGFLRAVMRAAAGCWCPSTWSRPGC